MFCIVIIQKLTGGSVNKETTAKTNLKYVNTVKPMSLSHVLHCHGEMDGKSQHLTCKYQQATGIPKGKF